MENNTGIAHDHIEYTVTSQPINVILASCKLPTLIRYDPNQQVDPYLLSPHLDTGQTLLLHSAHTQRRVHARGVLFDSEAKTFEDSGLNINVDEKYPGWFAVFGSCSQQVDPVVPYYHKVSQLAISSCCEFLISGNQPLEAMKLVRFPDGGKGLESLVLSPGTVLTRDGMYTVTSRIKIRKNLLQKKLVHKEEVFMSCLDCQNNEVLISCQAQGVFYVLTQASGQVKIPIMMMGEIISRYKFPILVKLIHGKTVQMSQSFNGTFILLEQSLENISLVSTIFSSSPKMFEMKTDAPLRFLSAIKNAEDIKELKDKDLSVKESLLFECLRLRTDNAEDQGSVRSSSTSGNLSCLSEKKDPSQNNDMTDTPLEECTGISEENMELFTLHKINLTPEPIVKKSKSKRIKVKSQNITRKRMYDIPKANIIPIFVKHNSFDSGGDTTATSHDYQNERKEINSDVSTQRVPPISNTSRNETLTTDTTSTELYASPPSNQPLPHYSSPPSYASFSSHAPLPLSEDDHSCYGEYGRLWGDSLSVNSDESADMIIENVTIRTLSPNKCQDKLYINASSVFEEKINNQYVSNTTLESEGYIYNEGLSLQDAVTQMREQNIPNDISSQGSKKEDCENPYNELAYDTYRCSKHGVYLSLDSATPDKNISLLDSCNVLENIEHESRKEQTYENDPKDSKDARPASYSEQNGKDTLVKTNSFDDYVKIDDNDQIVLAHGTDNIYERPENIFEWDHLPDSTVTPPPSNVNLSLSHDLLFATNQPYNRNMYINLCNDSNTQDSHYVKPQTIRDGASPEDDYVLPQEMNTLEYKLPCPRYSEYSSPSSVSFEKQSKNWTIEETRKQKRDSDFQRLQENMKELRLKPETQEAIKCLDFSTLQTSTVEEDLRQKIIEVLPEINKIDLNKICMFFG